MAAHRKSRHQAEKHHVTTSVVVLVLGSVALGGQTGDMALQEKMIKAQEFVLQRAIHPTTKLIYGGVNLEDPDRWQNTVFPPPEKVRDVFASDSYTPNVSNCALSAGFYLSALVDCYDVTGSAEWAKYAKSLFEGARTLAQVSGRKGFIARCVLPGDGKTHYLNSSVDQYTWYVYGLWKYYHCPMSTQAEKEQIKQIANDICLRIEEDGFTIRAVNGIPAPVSDIGDIRSDRSSRLLEMYLVGYDITKSEHWLEIYHEKLKENRHARLRSILDPEQIVHPYNPRDRLNNINQSDGAILQTQVSLVPLFELETDITVRACYLEAMRINARLIEKRPRISANGMQVVLLSLNRSLITPVVLDSDSDRAKSLRDTCAQVLMYSSRSSFAPVAMYWTAVKQGLFIYTP